MSASTICHLLHQESQRKIYLLNQQPKILGRNHETGITDLFVSKKQVECTADTERNLVYVRPLGHSVTGIDGYAALNDKTYSIGHGHKIELRLGFHEYEVVFDPAPVQIQMIKKEFPIFNLKNDNNMDEQLVQEMGTWEMIDNKELLVYTPDKVQSREKIGAFDVDGTIIKTKSGKRFPINADDWEINISVIPSTLRKLYHQNYKIVFFTNQSGIGKDFLKIKEFKRKIENILKTLNIPVEVYVALGKSFYRKPMIGMFNILQNLKNDGIKIDMDKSFYVGDAAGRKDDWAPNKKKDHSGADRLFAINVGLTFYTPEEYFLKTTIATYDMPEFDPRNLTYFDYPNISYDIPNVIIMVGYPGSGKSHFCNKILVPKGYVYISRDKLGSWQKCVKSLENALIEQKNCVIDNTNIDKESRSKFIEICKKYNVDCRCCVMITSTVHCRHNNKFRELTDKTHVNVSEIIINSMKKKYQEPCLTEGFTEILKIPFVPKFDDKEKEKLYKMFLLEK